MAFLHTCHCISHLPIGEQGFLVEGETIHTKTGCYHASLFQDMWQAWNKNSFVSLGTKYSEGRKDDATKVRWDLLPWVSLEQVAKVMQHGAKKYGEYNWLHVLGAKPRYFAAAVRHLYAWWRGESYDEDSGLHHLAHCACCVLFLIHFDSQQDVPTPKA